MRVNLFRAIAVIITALVIAAPGIATADTNSGDSTSTTSTSTDKTTTSSDSTSTSTAPSSDKTGTDSSSSTASTDHASSPTSSETETETQKIESTDAQEGQQYVSSLAGSSSSNQNTAARVQYCQSAAQGLQTMLAGFQKNAQTFYGNITNVYNEALAYQKSSGATPSNLGALTTAATAAQLQAQAAVSAMNALSVNLNCTSATVATSVAIFRAALQQTRTYLTAYQTAVNNLLTALES